MNAHDSERIKGMLEELGLVESAEQESADVLVFNTCTIREKPDQRFAAHLAQARALKERDPEKVIAGRVLRRSSARAPVRALSLRGRRLRAGLDPAPRRMARRGRRGLARPVRSGEALVREPAADAPGAPVPGLGPGLDGLQPKCAYCIVPSVRGREQSRRPGEVIAEVEGLARAGVREITLLGQNVNSYGRDLLPDIRTDFGELLRACDAVDGIERIRFTSPHPKDFRAPVIAAMAECAVCEHAHLPLQSGSTRILKAMRRTAASASSGWSTRCAPPYRGSR